MTKSHNTHPQKQPGSLLERQPVYPPDLRTQHDPIADLVHPYVPKVLRELDKLIDTFMPQPPETAMAVGDASWAEDLAKMLSTSAPASVPTMALRLNELETIQHWLREALLENNPETGQLSGPGKEAFGERVHAFAALSRSSSERARVRTLQLQQFGQLLPSLLGLISDLQEDGVRITNTHVKQFEALGITIQPGTVSISHWFLLIVKAQRILEQRWLHATTASHVVHSAMMRGQLFAQTSDALLDALLKIRAGLQPDISQPLPEESAARHAWIDQALSNPLDGVWRNQVD